MIITLVTGTMELTEELNGWTITSPTAIAEGAEDVTLVKRDYISVDGDVYRDGEIIANIA